MADWIYIKNDKLVNALALSVALNSTHKVYNIVRKTRFTAFFLGHPKVGQIGHPKSEDNVIVVDIPSRMPFNSLVTKTAEIIGIISDEINLASLYLPEVADSTIISRIPGNSILLFLNEVGQEPVDLMFIDEVCKCMSDFSLSLYSVGSPFIPCIRGTKDLRGLIHFPETIRILQGVKIIITNAPEIRDVCNALLLNVFYLCENGGIHYCNNTQIAVPGQMANMITKTLQ